MYLEGFVAGWSFGQTSKTGLGLYQWRREEQRCVQEPPRTDSWELL